MAITIGQIESAQRATRQLSEDQLAALRPLAVALGDWQRMGFTTEDVNYRRACRLSAYAGAGEALAQGLLAGDLPGALGREITERLDPRDRRRFRKAFAAEIAAALAPVA